MVKFSYLHQGIIMTLIIDEFSSMLMQMESFKDKFFDALRQTFALKLHVTRFSNFTASIVRMMIVKDFLGEDQNADV